jgi:hypothetical protein
MISNYFMNSVVNDFVIGSFKEFIYCPLTWAAGQAVAEADSTSVSAYPQRTFRLVFNVIT